MEYLDLTRGLDNAGFMRLSTVRPYVRHIGNRLPKSTVEHGRQRSLAWIGRKEHDVSTLSGSFRWLLRRGKVQRFLKKLYSALFILVSMSEGKFGESR